MSDEKLVDEIWHGLPRSQYVEAALQAALTLQETIRNNSGSIDTVAGSKMQVAYEALGMAPAQSIQAVEDLYSRFKDGKSPENLLPEPLQRAVNNERRLVTALVENNVTQLLIIREDLRRSYANIGVPDSQVREAENHTEARLIAHNGLKVTEGEITNEFVRQLYLATRETAGLTEQILEHMNLLYPDLNASSTETARVFELLCIGADHCYKKTGHTFGNVNLFPTHASPEQIPPHDIYYLPPKEDAPSQSQDVFCISANGLKDRIEGLRKPEQWLRDETNSGRIVFAVPIKNLSVEEDTVMAGYEEGFHAHQFKRPGGLGFALNVMTTNADKRAFYAEEAIEVEASYETPGLIRDFGFKAEIAEPYRSSSFDPSLYQAKKSATPTQQNPFDVNDNLKLLELFAEHDLLRPKDISATSPHVHDPILEKLAEYARDRQIESGQRQWKPPVHKREKDIELPPH